MTWIELKDKTTLVNLDTISSINTYKNKVELWIAGDNTGPYSEVYDTNEEAIARYEELKSLVIPATQPKVKMLLKRCTTCGTTFIVSNNAFDTCHECFMKTFPK